MLLEQAGIPFEVRAVDIPEIQARDERAEPFALRLAAEKALAGAQTLADPSERRAVLGADTIVVLGDQVLGKPRDEVHAAEMLRQLVGKTHTVTTAVAVVASDDLTLHRIAVHSRVTMRLASAEEVRDYVATGESLDKAGSYALQGEGRRFIDAVEGSETNVIGLPLHETRELLATAGFGNLLPAFE